MAANSKVEWTHHTRNFWIGCEKVSEACKNCYAEVETYVRVQRHHGRELWGKGAHRHIVGDAALRELRRWDAAAAAAGERHRVFVNSMSDFFEKRADLDGPRWRAWKLMSQCPNLDFLLLTKRPENIREMLPDGWGRGWANIWLGCTIENQERAAERLRHLLMLPAVVHFVSAEPLLGAIDLTNVRWRQDGLTATLNALTGEVVIEGNRERARGLLGEPDAHERLRCSRLDWVIIGGESGRNPRAFDVGLGLAVLRQTRQFGVKAFVKQLGANVRDRNDEGFGGNEGDRWDVPELDRIEHDLDGTRDGYQGAPVRIRLRHKKGGDPVEWPVEMQVREFPKPRAA